MIDNLERNTVVFKYYLIIRVTNLFYCSIKILYSKTLCLKSMKIVKKSMTYFLYNFVNKQSFAATVLHYPISQLLVS